MTGPGADVEANMRATESEAPAAPETVEKMPSLGALYARGLAAAGRKSLLKKRSEDLPQRVLSVSGVPVDREADRTVREAAGGRGGEFASAEYLHVLTFPLAMQLLVADDFPLPLLGLVHLRNTVDYFSPASFDDQLVVTAFARNLAAHPAGTTVEVVVEAARDGKVVFRDAGVHLARGVYLKGRVEKGESERGTFEGRTSQWRLGADAGRAWARVSGDYNPIHLSGPSAKALGMKTAIAHGMYSASRVVEQALPAGLECGFRWSIDFLTPIFLPATVDVRLDPVRQDGKVVSVEYRGWNGRNGKAHFIGAVSRLGG